MNCQVFIWGMFPLVFSVFYKLAGMSAFLLIGFIFPVFWIYINRFIFKKFKINHSYIYIHIPSIIFFLIACFEVFFFNNTPSYIESKNIISATLSQLFFYPAAFFETLLFGNLPVMRNSIFYFPIHYFFCLVIMIICGYIGYILGKIEQ